MGQTVDLAPALWLTTSISGTPTDAGGPYGEQQLNYLLQALHGKGQSGIVAPGDFTVTALSPTPGAQVQVSAGGAWIAGSSSPSLQGVYLIRSTALQTLDVPAASTTIARNDIVVLRVLDATYDGNPVAGINYRTRIEYIQGNQTTGAAPATPANCIILAKILVPSGTSTVVNSAAITNQIQYGSQVNVMWPWVGPPTSGTYTLGATGYDQNGTQWINTASGSPGSWAAVGSGLLPVTNPSGVPSVLIPVPSTVIAPKIEVSFQLKGSAAAQLQAGLNGDTGTRYFHSYEDFGVGLGATPNVFGGNNATAVVLGDLSGAGSNYLSGHITFYQMGDGTQINWEFQCGGYNAGGPGARTYNGAGVYTPSPASGITSITLKAASGNLTGAIKCRVFS